jgi:hypothetical protein
MFQRYGDDRQGSAAFLTMQYWQLSNGVWRGV